MYASNSHVTRRQLRNELNSIQHANPNSWCMIGDLNAIIGSHEKLGRWPPNKTSTSEFLIWTNQNELIHFDTNESYYT